jgi:hypothetical protein
VHVKTLPFLRANTKARLQWPVCLPRLIGATDQLQGEDAPRVKPLPELDQPGRYRRTDRIYRDTLGQSCARDHFACAGGKRIITNLLMAGAQGMQLALLAPGWLHGCLGLWITLRRFNAMQRIKYLLVVLVVFIPLFAAAGFLRMAAEVLAMGPPLSAGPHAVIAKVTLAAWKDYLTMVYLGAVFATFLLGQLHALVQRRNWLRYCLGERSNLVFFSKIISGRIDGVARPRLEWRECHRTVEQLNVTAHLSATQSACTPDCESGHVRPII